MKQHDGRDGLTRRRTLRATTASAAAAVLPACQRATPTGSGSGASVATTRSTARLVRPRPVEQDDALLALDPLGARWETLDPFLFCVHHDDAYPAGNDRMGPAASLAGRDLGQDFEAREGWRMYHGEVVPGFPQHPHRGFETVTVTRRGLIDHADSLGATARYGGGDVQWLTAGAGIVHAEMFPLLARDRPNPLELFQIWVNLPRADKLAKPHFSMFWKNAIPVHAHEDDEGRCTTVTVVAGDLAGAKAPAPPPQSWASRRDSDVAIWTIAMQPGARFTLPAGASGVNRALYFFAGTSLTTNGRPVAAQTRVRLRGDMTIALVNGDRPAELLLLQGRPIGEPTVQYGPFVMNTREEIDQAFVDYRRTGFGGWPWPSADPVHGRAEARFAVHADGRRERAG
jgi:hypothetical protein